MATVEKTYDIVQTWSGTSVRKPGDGQWGDGLGGAVFRIIIGGQNDTVISFGSEVFKVQPPDTYRTAHRFEPDVPKGSTINRTKMTQIAAGAEVTGPQFRVGLLEPDGFWDPIAGVSQGVADAWEVYSTVHALDLDVIAAGNNNSLGNPDPDDADTISLLKTLPANRATQGISFTANAAGAPHTLESVDLRLRRSIGPALGDMVAQIFATVGGGDPRATGSPIATSDVVLGSVLPPAVQTDVNFPFTGADRITITAGQTFVVKLVESVAGVPQASAPDELSWVVDSGGHDVPTGARGNGIFGILFTSGPENGFGFSLYPSHEHGPQPTPQNSDVVNAGVLFQDTLLGPLTFPTQVVNTAQEWGDAGYSPDVIVTGLASLIQDWIDDAAYDESGTPMAVVVEPYDNVDLGPWTPTTRIPWYSDDHPTYPGMRLTIEYDEPQPTKATVPDPFNGETAVLLGKILGWTAGAYAGSAAITHDVYFGTNPDPSGDFQGNQPGTTFDPGGLSEGVTYFWRIDEVGEFGTTTGDVWSFTACTIPTKASNPSPANAAIGVLIDDDLSWTAGVGSPPVTHDVYFGTDADPSGNFLGNQPGTTFDPGTLLGATNYFWRIDEVGPCGTTTGDVWNFRTEDGLLASFVEGTAECEVAVSGRAEVEFAVVGAAEVEIATEGAAEVEAAVDGSAEAGVSVSGGATIEPFEE